MGCLFSLCTYPLGNIVYVVEKIASCCAVAAVISCLVATLTIMLGVGVGLGYNYCFVDFKVNEVKTTTTALPTTSTSKGRSHRFGDDVPEYQEQLNSPDNLKGSKLLSKVINLPLMSTIVVPLNEHKDLMLLISKIKESNKNITLELIT